MLLGHRGSGKGVVGGHRENTLASLLAAVDQGLDWVELDVRRGADALVVVHDPWLADGARVVEQGGAELATAGVDLLADVLAALPSHVGVDLDVKTALEDAITDRAETTGALLAPTVEAERHRRPLVVTSFDPAALLVLRERAPEVPVGLLTWVTFPIEHAVAAARHLGVDLVGVHVGSLLGRRPDPVRSQQEGVRAVEVAHRAGLEVLAWCPLPEVAVPLAEAGVDALVVDDIPGVQAALSTRRATAAGVASEPRAR